MQQVDETVIAQYSSDPVLISLIRSINLAIDPAADIQNFYNNVFNIATAVGAGLDILGRIIGVNRVIQVASGAYFGMSGPDGASGDSFDTDPFYSGGTTTGNYALTDDAYRTLLYAKAAANITDGSIPSINKILMTLFGSQGVCYCTDPGAMQMTFRFKFTLSPVDLSIISQSGALPRPPGVALSIVQGP